MTTDHHTKIRAARRALEFLTRWKNVVAVLLVQFGLLMGSFHLLRRFTTLDARAVSVLSVVFSLVVCGAALWLLISRLVAREK